MNRLSTAERTRVLRALVEGNGRNATARLTGHSIRTVDKFLLDLGTVALYYQNEVLRDLPATRIECDEIKTFVYARNPRLPANLKGEDGYGETWVWVAFDPDTKLVCTWLVGKRGAEYARAFIRDLASRLRNRIQLTTDGHVPYMAAVEETFGGDIDYAVSMKQYGWAPKGASRSGVVLEETIVVVSGKPDETKITTAGVERQNRTMRSGIACLRRMSGGHSKKVENLGAAVALHYMHYNFSRPHHSLRNPYPRTPAMAAGLTDAIWSAEDIADMAVWA